MLNQVSASSELVPRLVGIERFSISSLQRIPSGYRALDPPTIFAAPMCWAVISLGITLW